jgi:hypothetical protein
MGVGGPKIRHPSLVAQGDSSARNKYKQFKIMPNKSFISKQTLGNHTLSRTS